VYAQQNALHFFCYISTKYFTHFNTITLSVLKFHSYEAPLNILLCAPVFSCSTHVPLMLIQKSYILNKLLDFQEHGTIAFHNS